MVGVSYATFTFKRDVLLRCVTKAVRRWPRRRPTVRWGHPGELRLQLRRRFVSACEQRTRKRPAVGRR